MQTFADEHEELRSTVRKFLSDQSDEQAVRTQMASESGWDPEVWRQLAEQVGLTGLIIPEKFDGAEFGYVELCIVAEEMGRALLCAPYLSTAVMATNALLQCTSVEVQAELLPQIAAGTSTATLAYADSKGRWEIGRAHV